MMLELGFGIYRMLYPHNPQLSDEDTFQTLKAIQPIRTDPVEGRQAH